MTLKKIADLCNKDYINLTTDSAQKATLLDDAQAAYDVAVQAVVDVKVRLFALFTSASIVDTVHVLTDDGILLKVDPVAKTVEKVEK